MVHDRITRPTVVILSRDRITTVVILSRDKITIPVGRDRIFVSFTLCSWPWVCSRIYTCPD